MKRLANTFNQDVPKAGVDDMTAAAAALASLSSSPNAASAMEHATPTSNDESHGNVSDSETSCSSQNSVLPKVVHAPPQNSIMVDHTYTDYSVIDENSLAFLEEGDDFQSNLSEEKKKEHARHMRKLKIIFHDSMPDKRKLGGALKPFPVKVRIRTRRYYANWAR